MKLLLLAFAVLAIVIIGSRIESTKAASRTNASTAKLSASVTAATKPKPSECVGNTLSQETIVSISARHMWACDESSQVFDTPVITGNEKLASDLTPLGSYHVYTKLTNQHLIGSNGITSWNDFVNYDMPFLQNQYGHYDFHDATWRTPSDFGNIAPDTSNASHGCVEMSLSAAKWLYGWIQVGTTVKVIA